MKIFMKKLVWMVLAFVLIFTTCFVCPAAVFSDEQSGEGYVCFRFEDKLPDNLAVENATADIVENGVYGNGLFIAPKGNSPAVLLPFFAETDVLYSFSVWIKASGAVSFFAEDEAVVELNTVNGENGWVQYSGSHRISKNGDGNCSLKICGEAAFTIDDCLILSEKYHQRAVGGNLVSNGSFESGLEHWTWSGSEVTRQADGANGSNHSICTTVQSDWGCAKAAVDIRFGRKYKMTWYAKAVSKDAVGLDMKYIFDRAQTRNDDRTPLYSEHVVGALTEEWQRFEVIHQDNDNTPDQCLANLYFRAGTGKERVSFAVDEIQIEEIEDSYEVPSRVMLAGSADCSTDLTATFEKQGSAVGIYYRILKPFGEGFSIVDSGYATEQTVVNVSLPEQYSGLCRVEINAVDIDGIVGKTFYSTWRPKGDSAKEQAVITNIQEAIWTDATQTLSAETVCRGEGNGKCLMSVFAVYGNAGALMRIETAEVENVAGNTASLSVAVDGGCRAKYMLFDKNSFAPVKQADEIVKTETSNVLYVDAVNGRDFNSGSADKPLKSINGARVKVRSLLKTASEDIYVVFKEGEYTFGNAVTFTPKDTSDTVKVNYVSEKKGKASFTGGREAENFILWNEEKNIYRSYVGTDVETRQLFVDGIRAVRARSKDKLKDAVNLGDEGVGYTTTDKSLLSFAHIEDLEFVFYEDWTNSYCGVDSVQDNGNGTVTVTMEPIGWKYQWEKGNCRPTVPEYIENAPELLDEEGEWYLDRHEGYLYYKPRVFEDMNHVRVIMPICEEMLNLNGNSAFEPIRNLEFCGFVFENTTWNVPSTAGGFCCDQNNCYTGGTEKFIPGAINVNHADNICFVDCRFTRLGMTGLKMTGGLKNCKVVGNEFYDISGGALVVGDVVKNNAHNPDNSAYYVENIEVTDNYMHKIAVDYKGGAALSTGFPINSRVSNNEIYDTSYSGMHLGWGWNSYTKTVTEDFTVKQNYIHKVMNTKLFDGGGVYFLGRTNGSAEHPNVFSENYLYDTGNCYGMIYPDNGSTNWDILSNVVDLSKNPLWYRKNDKTPENVVMPARWLHIHMSTITDILLRNNYTTSDEALNNGIYNVRVEDLHVHRDADWPAEALQIIEQAGITEKYKDNFRYGLQEVDVTEQITLKPGETYQLKPVVQTGKEKLYHNANYDVFVSSSDEDVACVSAQTITAENAGTAELVVYVKEADILNAKTVRVTVENVS